ncbi:MAG: hypothetical protein EXS17_03540 [Phycisphaerales bacterium]|nr:hypothetical protein [Phycisphaerales bacterium]
MTVIARKDRVKIAPRVALDALEQQRAKRESLSHRGPSPSLAAGDPADRSATQLDPTKNARVTARDVLREEFAQVRRGVERVADETLPVADRLAGIHRARRGLKRLGALRDLLRAGFPRGQDAARTSIRRAKERLAETRQRDALALLLEELCALRSHPLTSTSAHQIAALQVAPQSQPVRDVLADLSVAERSMRLPSGAPIDWHEITAQLATTWGRARIAACQQWLGRTESWMHETRKQYQRLGDQLEALALCATPSQLVARKRLRVAAAQLGRARDLGMLAEMIDRSSPEGRAVANRAVKLRSRAVRVARDTSRRALVATKLQTARAMTQRISRA